MSEFTYDDYDTVFVLAGTKNVCNADAIDQLENFYSYIKNSKKKIVAATIPPYTPVAPAERCQDAVETYNGWIRKQAALGRVDGFVDFYAALDDGSGGMGSLSSDGVHPSLVSGGGHEKMYESALTEVFTICPS